MKTGKSNINIQGEIPNYLRYIYDVSPQTVYDSAYGANVVEPNQPAVNQITYAPYYAPINPYTQSPNSLITGSAYGGGTTGNNTNVVEPNQPAVNQITYAPYYAPINPYTQSPNSLITGSAYGGGTTGNNTIDIASNGHVSNQIPNSSQIPNTNKILDAIYDEVLQYLLTTIEQVRNTDGSIGVLKIPAIGLKVTAYDGDTFAAMKKGVGHLASTSCWNGNIGLVGHNRGRNDYFVKLKRLEIGDGDTFAAMKKGVGHLASTSCWNGNIGLVGHNRGRNDYFVKLKRLEIGDEMTYTTKLGTRTYVVKSITKIADTDMLIKQSTKNIYEQNIDEIIEMAKTYDVILSIGSSFRSANLKDALDQTYIMELEKQIKIADYCKSSGVNVIIETPGHASPQDIFSVCNRLNTCCPYPIMPLGPMPTDCAFEQDDVAASIGAALMGTSGCADILSVVTREEHTGGIPSIESTLSAIEKYAVVKHIIDIYKLNDTREDDCIAVNRSKNHSCILGIKEKCFRCRVLCPLDLATVLKDKRGNN